MDGEDEVARIVVRRLTWAAGKVSVMCTRLRNPDWER